MLIHVIGVLVTALLLPWQPPYREAVSEIQGKVGRKIFEEALK